MKQTNAMETLIGAIVIGIAVFFLAFAYTKSAADPTNSYILKAQFQRIDGLRVGSEVRVGGIRVGTVQALKIDPVTFLPTAQFKIQDNLKFPKDSQASIASSGLLGDKYLDLVPGGSEENLTPNETIYDTQDSVNFETLISKAIFQSKEK